MTNINTSAILLADTLIELTNRLTDTLYKKDQLEYEVKRLELAERTSNELLTKRIAESARLTELINTKNKEISNKNDVLAIMDGQAKLINAELDVVRVSNKNHLKEIADQRAAILSLRAEIKKLKRKR